MKLNDAYALNPPPQRCEEINEFIDKLHADNPQLQELPVDVQIQITQAIWADLQSQ